MPETPLESFSRFNYLLRPSKQVERKILNEIAGFIYLLSPGSIFIVTVEAEPRLPPDEADSEMNDNQREDRLFQIFQEEIGRYYPGTIRRNLITRNILPTFFSEILRN